MKTRNDIIYHCISCGHVVDAELEAQSPQCCGRTMTKAASKTVRDDDAPGEKAGGRPKTEPPVINARKKPR